MYALLIKVEIGLGFFKAQEYFLKDDILKSSLGCLVAWDSKRRLTKKALKI